MRVKRQARKSIGHYGLPRWVILIVTLCIVWGLWFVIGRVQRHDAFMGWRQGLEGGGRVEWPPWDQAWPKLPSTESTRRRPIDVTGAAAFVVRSADIMRYIPCYCGACPADHGSNLSCYVTGFRPDGSPIWTDHASTCPICVNVTREVMLMARQGQSLKQTRDTLDLEYVRAGYHPSTRTPHPPTSN